MFLSEWREFPPASCFAEKKTWWQLASPCCWNCARHLTCFLSVSVTRNTCNSAHEQTPLSDTIDSVLRHREVGRAKDLSALPRISSYICIHLNFAHFFCLVPYIYNWKNGESKQKIRSQKIIAWLLIPVLDIGKNRYTSSWLRDINASAIPTEDREFIAYFISFRYKNQITVSFLSNATVKHPYALSVSFGGKCWTIFLLELDK